MTNILSHAIHVSLLAIGCMACVCQAARTVAPTTNSTPEAEGIPSAAVTAWIRALEAEGCNVSAFVLSRNGKRAAFGFWKPFNNSDSSYFGIGEVSKVMPYLAMGALVTDGDMSLAEAKALMAEDATDPQVSHKLAAIVEKYGEKTLDQYVLRKVLNNLGGIMAYWKATADEQGLMNGGWGVQMQPFDLARIAELLLSRGMWVHRAIISQESTDAIAAAIPLGKGFGILGSKGQLMYIRPDLDMALVVFACTDRPQTVLELTEQKLIPAFQNGPITEPDEAAVKEWDEYRKGLAIPLLKVKDDGREPDKTDRVFEKNVLGITTGHLERGNDRLYAIFRTAAGVQRCGVGTDRWRSDYVTFQPQRYERRGDITGNLLVYAQGGWMDDNRFHLKLYIPEVPAITELAFTDEQAEPVVYEPPVSIGMAHSILNVVHTPKQARNSEGDMIKLKDGRLYLMWSAFHESRNDDATADLVARISADGGKTSSEQQLIIPHPEGSQNVMCVNLLRLADGGIALCYLNQVDAKDCRPVFCRSDDECATWSKPVKIIPDSAKAPYVVNNSRMVQLPNGRLLVPTMAFIGGGAIGTYYSDDVGKTWHRSKDFHTAKDSKGIPVLLQEPGVVTLKDGRMLMYARTGHGCQYYMYSSDNGDTWTKPAPSRMISPRSPATILRLSTGVLAAAWNDHSRYPDRRLQFPYHTGIRNPFTLGYSVDEGETWHHLVDLEMDGWNAYTALREYDGNLYIVYSAGVPIHGNLRVVSWPVSKIHP